MSGVWPNGLKTKPDFTALWQGYPGHYGLDMINFDINHAVLGGTVVTAGYQFTGGGWVVEILATNGDFHRYLHNRKGLLVTVGQKVATGQALGYQASTGMSTGKHLHFGVRKGGRWNNYVDPLPYLEALVGSAPAGGGSKPFPGNQAPLTDERENDMDIRYLHRTEGHREFMIVGASLGLSPDDPKQDGYRVTLDILTAQAWGAVYGTSKGDSWKGLTRAQYIRVQENARKLAADYRRNVKS